jgi:hypothetical protein
MPKVKIQSIEQLQQSLKDIGFDKQKVKKPKTVIVLTPDRVGALETTAKKLGGRYNPNGSGSSIGRTELQGGWKILAKSGSGGSGAGAAITKLTESAQCLYAASHYKRKGYTQSELSGCERYVDVDERFNNIYTKLSDEWIHSCILGAEKLKKKHPGNYTFHRGSSWVSKVERQWKICNDNSGKAFTNINKWSPADIWMTTSKGANIDLSSSNNLLELNTILREAYFSGDIIGVSLKKMKGTAKYKEVNVSDDRPDWRYVATTTGLRGFFMSGDGYLIFDGGKIQFRRFGRTWQGEIKGKNANMGKVSGGPIGTIMKSEFSINLTPQRQITNPNEKLMKQFYDNYSSISYHSKMTYDNFAKEVQQKDFNWWISKWLTVELLAEIEKMNKADKNRVCSSMLNYASSQSKLSGPYVKLY